ncbi:MAG: 3,4-dihydroxy-2-butanone-4-phosphate synthase [Rhodomicrobium sp.]|nr:3,4-dihydroxy-2-butanone-4-phosphate synthase [Rhodomicrobium sp.]
MQSENLRVTGKPELLQQLSPVEDILEDARQGRMFVLVDAEDRENDGDLVIPAQKATPDAINFMARFGRGLICLAITPDRAETLHLQLMARSNQSRHTTAFTVSIEAKEGISTGISAYDRAKTIAAAIDPEKDWRDIVSPGHVFPLVAQEGGVLVRAGHTEAAVDLARLAGLLPAGVICEIMNDDGTMARMPDLLSFAQRHGLKIGAIADLIAYRRRHESVVRVVQERDIETPYGGQFKLKVYVSSVDNTEHLALVKGDVATPDPVLVRMHAVNILEDLLGIGRNGSRRSLVERAMRRIGREGRGVIVVIRDVREGVIRARLGEAASHSPNGEPSEKRLIDYGIGAQILLDLGIKNMVLLSNSPTPKIVGLEGYGLNLVARRPIDDQ